MLDMVRVYGIRGTIELGSLEDSKRGIGVVIVAQDETSSSDLAKVTPDGNEDTGSSIP
jgi:hypothetical protein